MNKIDMLLDPTLYCDKINEKLQKCKDLSLGLNCSIFIDSTTINFDIFFYFEYQVSAERLLIFEDEEAKVDIYFEDLESGIVICDDKILFEFKNYTIEINPIAEPT